MYGDFSRLSFSRSSQYSGVWAQQGRVQLDADLNEQTAIVLDYLRTLTIDLIGPFGGPASAGFRVSLREHHGEPGVEISPGHYYVYGMRCVSPAPHPSPSSRKGQSSTAVELGLPKAPFFVELLVWEQTVTAIQDPRLIEPALGLRSPDTTLRSQVRWKVLAGRRLPHSEQDMTGDETRADVLERFVAHQRHPGPPPLLRARATALPAGGAGNDPSVLPSASGYRGVENQLYRVEVHTGGEAEQATFKWSRDNASVELPVDALSGPSADGELTAVVPTPAPDPRAGLEVGDWVELIDDLWRPAGRPGPLMSVQGIDPATGEVKLSSPDRETVFDRALHPFLRRWDQNPESPAPDNACPVLEADRGQEWIDLEDGVQIQFATNDAHYQRGDYWLLAARTATGGLLWPGSPSDPAALAPDGPARYRAPLALVRGDMTVLDLRTRFAPLPEAQVDEDARAPTVRPELPPEEPEHERPSAEDQPMEAAPANAEGQVATAHADATEIRAPEYRWLLRGERGFEPDAVFELAHGDTTVGRDESSGIRIDDIGVSRHHAILTVEHDGRLMVKDAASANGTFVNSKPVSEMHVLEHADLIAFGVGGVRLRVERRRQTP